MIVVDVIVPEVDTVAVAVACVWTSYLPNLNWVISSDVLNAFESIETTLPSKLSVDIPVTVTPVPKTLGIDLSVCPITIPDTSTIPVTTADPIPNVPTPTDVDLKKVPIPPTGCPIDNANVAPGSYPLPPLPTTSIDEIVPAAETLAVNAADTGSFPLQLIIHLHHQ